jgi:hypothetical protein
LSSDEKICVRCGKPVTANADKYELFEKMHWLCFHLEFEHDADPDSPCSDFSSCPWWHIKIFERQLRELGQDPKTVIQKAIEKEFKG